MNFPRASGLLLHPTSLPGPFGIGDLGPEAYAFADFLIAAGQSLWQVLPLGPTGYGNSPYACYSAFAGNTLLVNPDQLRREALIPGEALASLTEFPEEKIDFEAVQQFKDSIQQKAFDSFQKVGESNLREDFADFCASEAQWLEDYALFRALKDQHEGLAWTKWESGLARRDPKAIAAAKQTLASSIEAQKFYQFLFFRQWAALKAYCNERGIKLIGDIPIFVAHDSADVWVNRDQFKLNEDGTPLVVAGVPPDYFSETGQLWGNPIYDWGRMRADGFKWWIDRVRAALKMFDIVRLDHFRGFAACWEIPAGEKTAERGQWVEAPGRELFSAVKESLGDLPIIAEDLGVITPEVEALRDEFGFPGMRVLQFAFGDDTSNTNLPHNFQQNVVVYTGTHDNDTAVGWFNIKHSTSDVTQSEREKESCLEYLRSDGKEINWDLIRAALASVANTALVPLQDVLGLGSEARMNLPSSKEGNWNWRVKSEALTDEVAERLRQMTELYGRSAAHMNGGKPAFPPPS